MEGSVSRYPDFSQNVAHVASLLLKLIESGNKIRVISHLDADGLAAASIHGKAFHRCDAEFRIRIVKQLDSTA
ncbi:hypothetical protein MUP00_06455, partial [Candidatus Bathyarchaeota archaeon]|nr:hypothetical protein [Candidatus Bathyarchaeota archaeon]